MQKFVLWLDNFLVANGVTSVNWKAAIVVINIAGVILLSYLLLVWFFKWRIVNKKFKKSIKEKKQRNQFKAEINAGGKYIVDSVTGFYAKITRLEI